MRVKNFPLTTYRLATIHPLQTDGQTNDNCAYSSTVI